MNITTPTDLTNLATLIATRQRLVLAALVAATLILPASAADRVAARPSNTKAGVLRDALRVAEQSRVALQSIKDYSATFSKREIIGKKMITQRMQIKMRQKPFSVYLKFAKPHSGREVIYVDGQNDGRLIAHGTGIQKLLGTLKLKPTSKMVMKENRYPITEIGITKMLDSVILRWEQQADNTRVRYFPKAKLGKRSVRVIQAIHPKKAGDSPFHMTRLFIDNQTNLPVRLQQYGFPRKSKGKPPLLEEYTYSDLKTNLGLDSEDFDRTNPDYDF